MKRRVLAISCIAIIIILILTIIRVKNNNYGKIILSNEELNHSFLEIYEVNGIKIYSSFNDISYIIKGETYKLSDALDKKIITLDKIIAKHNDSDQLNDGGSILYYYKSGKITNKDFVLVKCNNLNGNKNYYIISEFDFTNSVCKK